MGLADLRAAFLEAYDDNNDGKIDIREVPTLTGDSCSIGNGPFFLVKM